MPFCSAASQRAEEDLRRATETTRRSCGAGDEEHGTRTRQLEDQLKPVRTQLEEAQSKSNTSLRQQVIIESIHRSGGLRRGLSIAAGTDILWTLNHPDTWMLLTGQRGWSPHAYETWLAQASCAQLFGTPVTGRQGRT